MKLRLIIALALIANSVAAQPVLNIVLTNNNLLLYWPMYASNYVLQASTNLASTNWVLNSGALPANYSASIAASITNTERFKYFRLIQIPASTSDGMNLIPAGSFVMGNSLGDGDITDAGVVTVNLSAFYMDTNLVSLSLWQSIFSWATNHGYSFTHAGFGKTPNNPVQTVSWYDTVKWCNARSQAAGLIPAYYVDAGLTQTFTNGEITPYVNWQATGHRLPTEAEWEKAARGGLSGKRFPWGNTISESQADYYGNTAYSYDLGPNGFNSIGSIGGTSPATSPVGSFPPNGFGLFDMAGNLDEWCGDWYGTPYSGGGNPHGPASGSYRVVRGGSWANEANYSRCAIRIQGASQNVANIVIGFRCVRGF